MQLQTSKFNSLIISKFNSMISQARNEQQNIELGMQNSNINFGGNHPPYNKGYSND
jgi:small-conductance mechanosensitive channel